MNGPYRLEAWALDGQGGAGRVSLEISRGRIAERTTLPPDASSNPSTDTAATPNPPLVFDASAVRSLIAQTGRLALGDRYLLVPGFIDCHTHLLGVGMEETRPNLAGAQSREDALARLADWLQRNPGEGPLIGEGWDQSSWPDPAPPTRADLDRLTHRPFVLRRVCGHIAVLNSAALVLLGTDWSDLDPESGLAKEALPLSIGRIWRPDRAEVREALLRAQAKALAAGVVAVHEMGDPGIFRGLAQLEAEGLLELRVLHFFYAEFQDAIDQAGLVARFGGRLRVAGIKIFLDGSFGGRSAAVSAPYRDGDDRGLLLHEESALREQLRRAAEAGYRVALHAIGDRAIEQALAAFRMLEAEGVSLDHPRLEHAEMLHPEHLAAIEGTSVVLSMQPNFTARWQGPGGLYEQVLGVERARRLNPYRSVARKPRLLFGSDTMPLDPLLGLRGALGHPLAEERLSMDEALRAYTLWPRWYSEGLHGEGGLRPRDPADFAILELPALERELSRARARGEDLDGVIRALRETRTIEPLEGARVAATWVRGRVVFAADSSNAA